MFFWRRGGYFFLLAKSGLKGERKTDRAQLYPHLWQTGEDKGWEEEKGKGSQSLRVSSSLCIFVCELPTWLAVARCLSLARSSTTLLVVTLHCLLDSSNQSDLKLLLMFILSRHGEPVFPQLVWKVWLCSGTNSCSCCWSPQGHHIKQTAS